MDAEQDESNTESGENAELEGVQQDASESTDDYDDSLEWPKTKLRSRIGAALVLLFILFGFASMFFIEIFDPYVRVKAGQVVGSDGKGVESAWDPGEYGASANSRIEFKGGAALSFPEQSSFHVETRVGNPTFTLLSGSAKISAETLTRTVHFIAGGLTLDPDPASTGFEARIDNEKQIGWIRLQGFQGKARFHFESDKSESGYIFLSFDNPDAQEEQGLKVSGESAFVLSRDTKDKSYALTIDTGSVDMWKAGKDPKLESLPSNENEIRTLAKGSYKLSAPMAIQELSESPEDSASNSDQGRSGS